MSEFESEPEIIGTFVIETPDVISGIWETALEGLVEAQRLQLEHSKAQMDRLETQGMALADLERRFAALEGHTGTPERSHPTPS